MCVGEPFEVRPHDCIDGRPFLECTDPGAPQRFVVDDEGQVGHIISVARKSCAAPALLLADLRCEGRNGLLTLARMWPTTATGAFVPKDDSEALAHLVAMVGARDA